MTDIKKIDIVIAHYRENIDWLKNLNNKHINKIYVYTKSSDKILIENPRIVHEDIQTIGRESQTYLHHCLNHYHDLKNKNIDFVFFLQAAPHGLDTNQINRWIQYVIVNNLKFTYNFRLSSPNDFLDNGRCREWGGKTKLSEFAIKEWSDKLIQNNLPFKNIPIFWNACFGVSTECLCTVEKTRILSIIDELNDINPEAGHFCERLWYYIFNMHNFILEENIYSFFGGSDGRNYFGIIKLSSNGLVTIYDNFNERFWTRDDSSITLYNGNKDITCILTKINNMEYLGDFLHAQNTKHRLIRIT
jgi:hypothetical protein